MEGPGLVRRPAHGAYVSHGQGHRQGHGEIVSPARKAAICGAALGHPGGKAICRRRDARSRVLRPQAPSDARSNEPSARWTLAAAANIEREQLEALEAGRRVPADDLLLALSAGLGSRPVPSAATWTPPPCSPRSVAGVRELREQRGAALGHLAGGINRVTAYELEAGHSDPHLTTTRYSLAFAVL